MTQKPGAKCRTMVTYSNKTGCLEDLTKFLRSFLRGPKAKTAVTGTSTEEPTKNPLASQIVKDQIAHFNSTGNIKVLSSEICCSKVYVKYFATSYQPGSMEMKLLPTNVRCRKGQKLGNLQTAANRAQMNKGYLKVKTPRAYKSLTTLAPMLP